LIVFLEGLLNPTRGESFSSDSVLCHAPLICALKFTLQTDLTRQNRVTF